MSLIKPVITPMNPEMEAKLASLPQPLFGPTSFLDYVDRSFDDSLHLTKEESDYLCEHTTNEDLDLLVTFGKTFAQKRQAVAVRNKYKKQFSELK